MWSSVVFLGLIFPVVILGLDRTALEFSVYYFEHRNAKFICLLTCEKDKWTHSFVKLAVKYGGRISFGAYAEFDAPRLQACLLQTYVSVGVLVDSDCEHFEEVMIYASKNSYLDSKHHWLILHNAVSNNGSYESIVDKGAMSSDVSVLNTIEKLNVSVDTDISLATQGLDGYEVYELFNFGKIQGGNLNIRKSGNWSTQTGTKTNLNKYKYYRRFNFHQFPLRLIAVVSKPEQFDPKTLTDGRFSPDVVSVMKISTSILSDVANIHNFRNLLLSDCRFVYSVADRWIGKYALNESKYLPAATTLYFKQQDITPVLRFLTDIDRRVDFITPPIASIGTKFYYRIPTYGIGKFENQFLRPLSTGTWLLVVVVITLCAGVLVLSARLEKRPSAGQYAVFSVIASLCQQFFEDISESTVRVSGARKLTILVTGLFCVLIYNYYTSSVVSWLLNGPPPSINSLQELLESPLDLLLEDVGYTRSWLQTPNYYYNKRNAKVEDELKKKKVFNKKKNEPLLMPVAEGIKYVRAGGFAFHAEVDSANRLIGQSFTKKELCELGSLQSMEETLLYACLQKNSPYKEFFSWSIMRLYERGIVKCVQQRIKSRAVQREGSCPQALALGGAAPAFLLLAMGFILGTVIMFVERSIWKWKSKSKFNCKQKKKKLYCRTKK